MKQTTNYQLNQWDPEDRILRTDFNSDNAKIDAALALKGNCSIYLGSYEGTGTTTRSYTFPMKPDIVLIMGVSFYFLAIYGEQSSATLSGFRDGVVYLTWTGNTLSWNGPSSSAQDSCNLEGYTYQVVALYREGQ